MPFCEPVYVVMEKWMKAVMSQPMNFFCRADAAGAGCAGGLGLPAGEGHDDTEGNAAAAAATSMVLPHTHIWWQPRATRQ